MKFLITGAAALALMCTGCKTLETNGQLGTVLGEVLGSETAQSVLSEAEIEAGLREALSVSTNLVSAQLSAKDGFFADPEIHIPLPKSYRKIQSNLEVIGASGPLDDLELRLNRAAEDAVPEGKKLVLAVVQSITIEDALNILNGGDTAATDFLRQRTETQLRASFTPYVSASLAESGAFTSLENVAGQYGLGGVTSNLQSDLTNHAVGLGLDGMFHYIALEEKKIRENPVARTTEILRRVFGASA
ncbi:MAG: DUF4197 domain-containing protein [Hyphomonas sp.]